MNAGTHVRAIHHDGVLELLDPLELPEGAQVEVVVLPVCPDQAGRPRPLALAHPTRLVPAEKLSALVGLVAIGGDALAESEALYD